MLQGFENIIKAIKNWSKSEYQPKGDYATEEEIPTKTSDLENDNGFITKVVDDLTNYYKKSETYTKEEVASLIAGINTMQFSVVTELPTEDISTSTIYLVPAENGKTGNIYNEYLRVYGKWEVIGNTEIDLSGYLTTTGDSSATVSSGDIEAGDSIDIAFDEEDYPVLIINSTEKLRVKFKKISDCFNELVSTIKSKIPPLTTSLAVTEEGVSALDGTVGKVVNDKIAVNSDAISQIKSDLKATNLLKAHYMTDAPEVVQAYIDDIDNIKYPLIFAHTDASFGASSNYWQFFLTLRYVNNAVQICFSIGGGNAVKIRTKENAGITNWVNL